jgi:hypothetical protein
MQDCITKLEKYNGTPLQIDIGFQCATKEQYASEGDEYHIPICGNLILPHHQELYSNCSKYVLYTDESNDTPTNLGKKILETKDDFIKLVEETKHLTEDDEFRRDITVIFYYDKNGDSQYYACTHLPNFSVEWWNWLNEKITKIQDLHM